jgi:hypothetical protein
MRKYWGKITLGALLIFIVGYGVVSAGRKVKESIVTSKDLTIPLGSFVPFKFDGVKVGSIRQLRIRRSEPKRVAGFDVRVRMSDTAAFERLRDCKLTVTDARHFDERTSFTCLPSDSGYQAFGTVTAYLYNPDAEDPTIVTPLLLSDDAVEEIRRSGHSPSGDMADSLAREVAERARVLERQQDDSIEAARLDRRSQEYKARADSIRLRQRPPPAGSAQEPLPPSNPKPL